jgi:hydrogenase maturation protease
MRKEIKLMNAESDLTLDHFNDDSALIYGIGNIGRQDDGLGWAFVDWLETTSACANAEKVKFYQLNLEDADLISHKQRVLFVDASKDTAVDSFRLYKAESKMDFSFTSHAMSIETIMATCQMCFGKIPEVYVLAIRGYEWELQIGLTEQAKRNLNLASAHIYRTATAPSPKTDCCLQ